MSATPARRGRGRPRLATPRSQVVAVRLTAAELRVLKARARAAGYARLGDYVRSLLDLSATTA